MMKRVTIFLILVALSTVVQAGPKEDAIAAYDSFFVSFTNGNQDKIAGLFAPDAMFYGTSSTELVTSPEGVKAYFTRALVGPAVVKATQLSKTALLLSNDVVAISGTWQAERTIDGKIVINGPLRNTVVLHRRGDRWLIVQFHNSLTPKP
jgi:uncharacterized protein (TIGR02246 family)